MMVVFAFATLLAYSNSFDVPFQFDDKNYIEENELLRHFDQFVELFWYQPQRVVGFTTFLLNYQMGGLDVFGYHVVNLILHLLTGLFFFLFARELLSLNSLKCRKPELVALLAAGVFLAHPVQTQAVTYIWQRVTVIASLFYFASLYFYLKSSQSEENYGRNWWAALVCAVMAMFSKQIAYSIPLMILFFEFCFLSRTYRLKRSSWLLITLLSALPLMSLGFGDTQLRDLLYTDLRPSPAQYYLAQPLVMMRYLKLWVLPTDLQIDYAFEFQDSFSVSSVVCLIALVVSVFFAVKLRKRFPILLAGVGVFFIGLSVETLVPLADVIFEHRMYLPSSGLSLLSCAALVAITSKLKVKPAFIFVPLLCALFWTTYSRNEVWRSTTAIWQDVLRKNPSNYRANLNLSFEYERLGDLENAEKYLVDGTRKIDQIYLNLGAFYTRHERHLDAVKAYRNVIDDQELGAIAANNIGISYAKLGEFNQAESYFLRAVKQEPRHPSYLRNLGNAYQELRRYDEAQRVLRRCIEIDPDFGPCKERLRKVLDEMSKSK